MINFFKDKKNVVIALLCALSLIRIPQGGLLFLFWMLSAVLLSTVSDLLISGILQKRKIIPKSAIISGFIVSGVLDYHQPWFVLIIFSLLPVLSKHLLKFKHKHIFNPANLSLALATFLKIPLTWNIESNIYLIIIIGIYIAYALKKFPHIIGFLIFFSGLFMTQIANPFSLLSWFFIFVMLIEPKTSGGSRRRGFIFGSITAISAFLVSRSLPGLDFLVTGLFVANLFNPLLEKMEPTLGYKH